MFGLPGRESLIIRAAHKTRTTEQVITLNIISTDDQHKYVLRLWLTSYWGGGRHGTLILEGSREPLSD